MNPLKDTFQDRVARAAEAKQKALDKLRAKPEIDPQVAAERQAARLAKEAKLAEQRAAKEEARRHAVAEKEAAAREKEAAAREKEAARRVKEEAAKMAPPTEAELKAARDARYAARKSRKG